MSGRQATAIVLASPRELLAQIARLEVGNRENPRGSNRGPQIEKYFAADRYSPTPDNGYAWCAAFVSWCTQELYRRMRSLLAGMPVLRTAGAFDLIDQAKKHPDWYEIIPRSALFAGIARPQVGDIAVYEFSHCGILTSVPADPRARYFTAVEGNTDHAGSREGWEVAPRPRKWMDLRALIRVKGRNQENEA